jgi:hypothetical protein
MKLTEQQLAQMFQQSRSSDNNVETDGSHLHASMDASDQRLMDVERIADDSHLSASYQIINQLHDWSQAVGNDIKLSIKPSFIDSISENVLNWLKPTLATAAVITTIFFVTPQINTQTHAQQKPDRIMFTSSFESDNDVINGMSFEGSQSTNKTDVITKMNFS